MRSIGTKEKDAILFTTGSISIGGLETYVVNIIENLDVSKYQPIILHEGRGKDDYRDKIVSLKVPIYKQKMMPKIIPYLGKLKNIIELHRVKTICTFRGDLSGPSLWIANKCGIRNRIAFYRNTSRNYDNTIINSIGTKILHSQVNRYATKIIGNTSHVLDYHFPDKILWRNIEQFSVLHNGINIKRFDLKREQSTLRKELKIQDKEILLGIIGRLTYEKNHETLLKSFKRVAASRSDVHLVIVGDGKLRNKIEKSIEEKKLKRRVHLLGTRLDIPQILAGLDLFILPSISEGMPNALIEAMASGLPIVASDIEPIKEIVPKELKVQLINVYDVNGYTNRILENISKPEYMHNIAKVVKKWVENNFTIEKSISELCRLWNDN